MFIGIFILLQMTKKIKIKGENMSNNLRQAKKDLKAFAKRAKNVKYTESLLFSYLITGMVTFSIGLNTSSNVLYEQRAGNVS